MTGHWRLGSLPRLASASTTTSAASATTALVSFGSSKAIGTWILGNWYWPFELLGVFLDGVFPEHLGVKKIKVSNRNKVIMSSSVGFSSQASSSAAGTITMRDPRHYHDGNSWLNLPGPIVQLILGYTDPNTWPEVAKFNPWWGTQLNNEVVLKLSAAVYDPCKDFNVEVMDEKVWRRIFDDGTLTRHGLSFDDAEPLDKRALRAYLKDVDFSKIEGKEEQTGMAFITIPKGLTFNKLLALAKEPKEGGHVALFRHFWHRIPQDLGDVEVQKTYRIAISKNVLLTSRSQTYNIQKQKAEEMDGEMPGVLEATLLPVLKFMSAPIGSTPIRLFNDAPWRFTRCREKIDDQPLAVGGFAPAGLSVHYYFGSVSYGVGFIRKF